MDINAKLAELRLKKAAEFSAKVDAAATQFKPAEIKNAERVPATTSTSTPSSDSGVQPTATNAPASPNVVTSSVPATNTIGTARTSEIDHMTFLSNLQELETAIHGQHPKMPVLLMHIHKQISADPELVTVLKEEQIGVIVNALKIQTKTELVGTIAKQSKARDKKTKLDVDMF